MDYNGAQLSVKISMLIQHGGRKERISVLTAYGYILLVAYQVLSDCPLHTGIDFSGMKSHLHVSESLFGISISSDEIVTVKLSARN
jgi:hypothetical protein